MPAGTPEWPILAATHRHHRSRGPSEPQGPEHTPEFAAAVAHALKVSLLQLVRPPEWVPTGSPLRLADAEAFELPTARHLVGALRDAEGLADSLRRCPPPGGAGVLDPELAP